jgi:hypothetical protein
MMIPSCLKRRRSRLVAILINCSGYQLPRSGARDGSQVVPVSQIADVDSAEAGRLESLGAQRREKFGWAGVTPAWPTNARPSGGCSE